MDGSGQRHCGTGEAVGHVFRRCHAYSDRNLERRSRRSYDHVIADGPSQVSAHCVGGSSTCTGAKAHCDARPTEHADPIVGTYSPLDAAHRQMAHYIG